ncbi:hypothetical protein J6590_068487 [Homalodisca vitripennis]|nr:hypothetical protein J6590_068487 [Homalodisca vitripennis]
MLKRSNQPLTTDTWSVAPQSPNISTKSYRTIGQTDCPWINLKIISSLDQEEVLCSMFQVSRTFLPRVIAQSDRQTVLGLTSKSYLPWTKRKFYVPCFKSLEHFYQELSHSRTDRLSLD